MKACRDHSTSSKAWKVMRCFQATPWSCKNRVFVIERNIWNHGKIHENNLWWSSSWWFSMFYTSFSVPLKSWKSRQEADQAHQWLVKLRRPAIGTDGLSHFLQDLWVIRCVAWNKSGFGFLQHVFIHKLQPKSPSSCLRPSKSVHKQRHSSLENFHFATSSISEVAPHIERA